MISRCERSCRRHVRVLLILMFCLMPLAGHALAGQAQEASIIGQVTDESGGVLPGVTVTATSPALQVPQVVGVTNERGEYRLTPLPIGTYTVEYTLGGFQTARRPDIRLTAGFTARIDVAMKVGAVEETLTVSGAAPVVDVTSTANRTQLTREILESIPGSRNGWTALMAQAPGTRPMLDVGGSSVNATSPTFRAFGQDGESWQQIEGIAIASPKIGSQFGSYLDYASIEEATVQTVGGSADSVTRGVQLNVIIKSGGNDFHGGASWAQSSQRLQGSNLDDTFRAQGITSGNPIDERWERSADLGGRIVRNKLWFYYSGHARRSNDQVLNVFKPDGSPYVMDNLYVFSTEKVTYQMSPANRFIAFHHYLYRPGDNPGATQFVAFESRARAKFHVHTSKLEWQFAKGNTVVSVLGGAWIGDVVRTGFSDQIATVDQLTQQVTGNLWALWGTSFEGRKQGKATVTWYKPGAVGNHEVKTGVEYAKAYADRKGSDRGVSQNYQLVFRGGVPFQLAARNFPVYPHTFMPYTGLYVQDSWTLARRLTLNLGVRYAHDRGFLPDQCRVATVPPLDSVYPAQCFPRIDFKTLNSVVPRLHAAYDLTGDGKTVLKGGWSRFAYKRYVDEVQMASENVDVTTTFRWHDDNGNKRFDLGEVNFDRNGPDFVSTRLSFGSDALTGGVSNPNQKQQMRDEFSLSLERQLIPNMAVRVTGVYSQNRNTYRLQNNLRPYDVYNIPITNADPGPDGRLGTADDPGTFVTYYDYPAAYAGRAFQQPMLINDPKADQTYKSFEVAVSKRLANRWQFMTSYSATKSHIPYVPNTGVLISFDPNAEINAAQNTWEWLGRASGAYSFPADVLVSANFEHRSGDPQARTVSFAGGRQIPSITLRVEPLGAFRLPNLNLLDLRSEKSFRLRQGHRLALRLNLYNVLNINSVTGQVVLSGPSHLRPTAITPPRIAEVAMSYTF